MRTAPVSVCTHVDRQYATLYFVFWVDASESELGILDLIQVHMPPPRGASNGHRSLWRASTSALRACVSSTLSSTRTRRALVLVESALTWQVHYVLQEVVMGGMVLETDMARILGAYHEQEELVKREDPLRTRLEDVWKGIKRKATSS